VRPFELRFPIDTAELVPKVPVIEEEAQSFFRVTIAIIPQDLFFIHIVPPASCNKRLKTLLVLGLLLIVG
jgi:hypothetical protein